MFPATNIRILTCAKTSFICFRMSSGVTAKIDAQLMPSFMSIDTDKVIPLISPQWSIDVQKANIGHKNPK